eukprot:1160048-Pelagomonas_calceolata.AAC.2
MVHRREGALQPSQLAHAATNRTSALPPEHHLELGSLHPSNELLATEYRKAWWTPRLMPTGGCSTLSDASCGSVITAARKSVFCGHAVAHVQNVFSNLQHTTIYTGVLVVEELHE